MSTTTLDLGCGSLIKNPFNAKKTYGIDLREDLDKEVYKVDLVIEKIPFADQYFDYVTAYDFLEHIPRLIYNPTRRFPFIELMNEIHRVLKIDGLFLSLTPVFPHHVAFWDPTHVNIMTDQTLQLYFVQNMARNLGYGWNGNFNLVQQKWINFSIETILQKTVSNNISNLIEY
jgi:SAM-dependent methyltransferase